MAESPPAPDLAAVKRLHDAANDPTYSSPRVRRADIQAVVRLVDAQAARLAAQQPVVEAAERWYDAPGNDTETDEALAAAVLDWKDWQEAEAAGRPGRREAPNGE